ncbi:AMP-binding protein [Agrobacterium vitis]|nr:AMP-binding protein [Agrobacterium vitis]
MIETVHDDGPHSSLAAMLHKVSLARQQDLAVLGEAGTGFDLTFAELARGAASVAAALQGLRAADVAGMFVEPSVLMSLALWGIVWSGRGYVPLAPEYPDERLSYIIESSCLKQVIVQSCLVDRLRAIAPADVEILRIEELLAGFRSDTRAATEIAPPPSGGGPGLCDLYVRIDRAAQRCRGAAVRPCPPDLLACRTALSNARHAYSAKDPDQL